MVSYWPKFSFKKLVRLIRSDRRRIKSSGVSCHYVKWTKYVGLKLYTEKSQRDRCAKLQRRVAKAGLAPEVGGTLEFEMLTCTGVDDYGEDTSPDLEWATIYGYWTEHVRIPSRIPSYKRVHALWKGLRELGLLHDDLHKFNMGVIDGRLVCIDFDTASCRDVPKDDFCHFTYMDWC